jgi:hypothetical protein
MTTGAAFASTEARLFRAWWQDGLLDLLAGACLVATGLGWLAGFVLAGALAPAVALPLWPLLRQRITRPRLGEVRFAAARRLRMRHGLVAVVSLGVVLLGFVALSLSEAEARSELLRWAAPAIPALLLAALALSAAEALRLLRFALYAAGFVAAGLVVASLEAEPGWAILAGGALVLASGIRLLAVFLREFPRLPSEMDA